MDFEKMKREFGLSLDRAIIENRDDWERWQQEIPFIPFKPGWLVQPIPPFAGATARFRVRHGEKVVSVYLDCHERLGSFGWPYWEVCPVLGSNLRVAIDNIAGLVELIEIALQPDIEHEPTRVGIEAPQGGGNG